MSFYDFFLRHALVCLFMTYRWPL